MARVKNGVTTKKRHKKVLKQAKGYFGSKHRLYKTAKEQLMHSGQYAFRDRRQKKRDFRKLWITRINAACRANGMSYSRFIEGLTKAGVEVNRKMLSEIAINDEAAFAEIVKTAQAGLNGEVKQTITTEKKSESASEKSNDGVIQDLSKLTVAELKALATQKGIKGISTMKKADLIDALK